MRNLGPKSTLWLQKAGIANLEDLKAIGALEAYLRIRSMGENASLNLLWALEGACLDLDWREIPAERKLELKRQLSLQS